jgi:ubiquinone/menaquinone biosynthesis C-methylase UbiE
MTDQKSFWEDNKVLKRRPPRHPVIEAFAMPKIQKICSTISKHTGKKRLVYRSLLDIGCGNGYFSYYFKRFFDVVCLDFSYKILSICPMKKKIQASATTMPFHNNSFEIVFCANLLHHVDNPVDVINEMSRVSSRYIVIIEPNRYNPLMFLISQISKTDKSITKFHAKYLADLVKGKAEILSLTSTGFILPNITHRFFLPMLQKVEPLLFPKLYNLLIAIKN